MNVRQLHDVLILQESHCREDGNTEKADAIASFANLLQGYSNERVRVREARLESSEACRSIAGSNESPATMLARKARMNIPAFRHLLERLEKLYASAGANDPAKDFRSVSTLMDGHEYKTVDAFVAETKAALAAEERGIERGPVDDDAVVMAHVQRLLDAGTDQEAFEHALAALDRDNRADKSAWFAIANRHRNQPTGATHVRKFRSTKDPRQGIRDVFLERFDTKSKRGIIAKLTKQAS